MSRSRYKTLINSLFTFSFFEHGHCSLFWVNPHTLLCHKYSLMRVNPQLKIVLFYIFRPILRRHQLDWGWGPHTVGKFGIKHCCCFLTIKKNECTTRQCVKILSSLCFGKVCQNPSSFPLWSHTALFWTVVFLFIYF